MMQAVNCKQTENQTENQAVISSIDEVIEDVRQGKPIIVIDDEKRENEGDLCLPAEFATAETVNFMIQECGGFICVAIDQEAADRLELPLQARRGVSDQQARFTISIEAASGVTTGVSASDRAVTIRTAADRNSGPDDVVTPGHMFPLVGRENGVLDRAGHTEASMDFSRLAGFDGPSFICEIMNKDGTMARLSDLVVFAKEHGLKIATIEKLIAYRQEKEA